jgi:hypothetical protein
MKNEELSNLGDFEVNKLIAKLLNRSYVLSIINSDEAYLMCKERDEEIDYCNNPNDIMPIAFENNIGVCPWIDNWLATFEPEDILAKVAESTNKNPLRAICEVFILMNQ